VENIKPFKFSWFFCSI